MAVKSMEGGDGMSPRKSMAMGKASMGSDSFGVKPMGNAGQHPDRNMVHNPMEDKDRGIGMPIHHTHGYHPAQAAPSHGPMHAKRK